MATGSTFRRSSKTRGSSRACTFGRRFQPRRASSPTRSWGRSRGCCASSASTRSTTTATRITRVRRCAAEEERIILTRDRELLKCRTVTHGCYVLALEPRAQLREIVQRLGLAANMRPFTLCVHCNLPLVRVAKEEVLGQLPPMVAERHEQFHTCACCRRVYWKGTHWERLRRVLRELLSGDAASMGAADPPLASGSRH